MSHLYRTKSFSADSNSHPVVVHCSDPRYQPHFQDFLTRALGLVRYALIAVPGGAQFLAAAASAQKFSGMGWRWVKFVHHVARANRLILIGHADCRWYIELGCSAEPAQLAARVQQDLRSVAAEAQRRFIRARAELYFAQLSDDAAIVEPVALEQPADWLGQVR
jgi:hypothetical protein